MHHLKKSSERKPCFFYNKGSKNAIYTRSRLTKKPKQMKNIFEINEKLYRKQRNKCFNQEKIDKTMFF